MFKSHLNAELSKFDLLTFAPFGIIPISMDTPPFTNPTHDVPEGIKYFLLSSSDQGSSTCLLEINFPSLLMKKPVPIII